MAGHKSVTQKIFILPLVSSLTYIKSHKSRAEKEKKIPGYMSVSASNSASLINQQIYIKIMFNLQMLKICWSFVKIILKLC